MSIPFDRPVLNTLNDIANFIKGHSKYLDEFGKNGATQKMFVEFLQHTNVKIPTLTAEWLSLINGTIINRCGVYGIRADKRHLDIEETLTLFPEWITRGWFPIADDGCGNYYVQVTGGDFGEGFPIVFIETSSLEPSPSHIVASDIRHFLQFMIEEELGADYWPFDKDKVLEKDPNILKFNAVPLPWDVANEP